MIGPESKQQKQKLNALCEGNKGRTIKVANRPGGAWMHASVKFETEDGYMDK